MAAALPAILLDEPNLSSSNCNRNNNNDDNDHNNYNIPKKSRPSGTSSATMLPPEMLFQRNYELAEIIEKGPFGAVRRAIDRAMNVQYAVKIVELKKLCSDHKCSLEDVQREVDICSQLKHPFISELIDSFIGDERAYLVFDYMDGLDLCFEIVKRASAGFVYSEAVASHYLKQLLHALAYIHERSIVHRDVQPHCAVLANKENSAPVRLTGFAFAVQLQAIADQIPTTSASSSHHSAEMVGSAQFMAPEMVADAASSRRPTTAASGYGTPADMWSLGVFLHILLSGRLPFNGTKQHVFDSIVEGRYSLKGRIWDDISDYAKDLLMKLLTVDPNRRITAAEALKHPWIKERDKCTSRKHLHETVDELRRFNSKRKLKANVLSAVNSSTWTCNEMLSPSPSGQLDYRHMDGHLPHSSTSSDELLRLSASSNKRTNDASDQLNAGVEQVLFTLDEIAVLTDKVSANDHSLWPFYQLALNDERLHEFLVLYDQIGNFNAVPEQPAVDVAKLARQVSELIEQLPQTSAQMVELKSVLASAQLQALLQAHDVVVHEIYEGGETAGSSTPCDEEEGASAAGGTNNSAVVGVASGLKPTASSHRPPADTNYLVNGGRELDEDEVDEDDDTFISQVTRVRLVQFQKNTEEPMGITLKVTEEGRCVVARIMHGGMIHRQGDEIREINSVSVTNQSVESLQHMLRDVKGGVTFKIVPSYRSAPPACEIFVRAQFDYDPGQDDLIPCPQAGVPFRTGDVLQVISKDDHNWWQARHMANFPALGAGHSSAHQPQTPGASVAGLIPSPELQEWRTACLAMERAKDNSACLWFGKRKKYYTAKYLQKHSALFDQLDLVTYEEVIRLPSFRRKTLVLLGAHGVGRRHIKNTLIQRHPDRFAYPIPHTTRPSRKEEQDGKHYHFVSHDTMMADIQANEYLEYGTHEEFMYGTKLETIRHIHRQGKIAILDVEPQALKVLRTAEYSPFVVFIAAPNLQGLQDPDGSLERLLRESELLRQAYGHFFDFVILNNDIDETIRQLELIVEKLHTCPQWVPVSWVY